MTVPSRSAGPLRWQTREYVDSWLANQSQRGNRSTLQEKLVSLLPFPPGSIIRVLDIGTGSGALGLQVLGAYPKAELVCHDLSEFMLDGARQTLAPFLKAVTFVQSDLRDPTWTQVIEGQFDAVVSSTAVHDIAESDQRAVERIPEVYSEVFGLVKPGGCFLNYDFVSTPGLVVERIYHEKRLISEQAKLKAETGTEKSLQEIEQELQERSRSGGWSPPEPGAQSISNQLEWLKRAGFDEVDCFWKDSYSAMFGGFRY